MISLARDQLMTKGAMTGLADQLEEKGLVVRVRSKSDRRVINIEITKEGRRMVEKGLALYQRFVQKSLRDLSEEELASFLRILSKMLSSVQERSE
jgi:DNA-binding MarR family transcriptional regulator